MRVLIALAFAMAMAACNDPATTFASGLKSWCKSADNCTDYDSNR